MTIFFEIGQRKLTLPRAWYFYIVAYDNGVTCTSVMSLSRIALQKYQARGSVSPFPLINFHNVQFPSLFKPHHSSNHEEIFCVYIQHSLSRALGGSLRESTEHAREAMLQQAPTGVLHRLERCFPYSIGAYYVTRALTAALSAVQKLYNVLFRRYARCTSAEQQYFFLCLLFIFCFTEGRRSEAKYLHGKCISKKVKEVTPDLLSFLRKETWTYCNFRYKIECYKCFLRKGSKLKQQQYCKIK